jgi:hypothetical protein
MNDPVDLKSPLYHQNRRKSYKWVFLLLEHYHEIFGLKVVAWSGPEGIGIPRFNFFFDRIREQDGRPKLQFELDRQSVEMQMYQWTLGVFQPLPGEPQFHPQQSKLELRTDDIVP